MGRAGGSAGGSEASDDRGWLRIGQMARLNSVSEKALRVYQARGILTPAKTNAETGYRYYTLDQCATLDMVNQLQAIGLTLDQIADIAAAGDVEHLRACVEGRIDGLDARARQIAMARQLAQDLLDSCDVYLKKPPCNTPRLEYVPPRTILRFPLDHPANDANVDGHAYMASWERDLREVKRRILERGWPLALFRNVGCLVERDDLVAHRIRYGSAWVTVTPAFGEAVRPYVETIPGGVCVTEYVDSIYLSDGRERETVELLRLLDACERRGLEVAGDYAGEVIADGPAFCFDGRQMLFRMCLPVRVAGQQDA